MKTRIVKSLQYPKVKVTKTINTTVRSSQCNAKVSRILFQTLVFCFLSKNPSAYAISDRIGFERYELISWMKAAPLTFTSYSKKHPLRVCYQIYETCEKLLLKGTRNAKFLNRVVYQELAQNKH